MVISTTARMALLGPGERPPPGPPLLKAPTGSDLNDLNDLCLTFRFLLNTGEKLTAKQNEASLEAPRPFKASSPLY